MSPLLVAGTCLILLFAFAAAVEAGPAVPAAHPLPKAEQDLFPPGAVRLLDGPFKEMQDADHAYLLALEPDRLLAQFRVESGLEPKAKPYGGWEAPAKPGTVRSLAGHTAGHYLTALALMHRATDDPRLRERAESLVAGLAECQRARGDGSLVAFPFARELFADIAAGKVETVDNYWAPFYTIHKEMAGLRDAWLLLGLAEARDVLVKMADWGGTLVAGLPDARRERLLRNEHGGMAEVLADAYAITREPRHLAAARAWSHREVLDPAADGRDALTGLHANTQVPKFIGFQRIHELDGDARFGAAARFFWQAVVADRTWVNGGNSMHEHFFDPARTAEQVTHDGGPETCNTYNMLKLTEALYRVRPDAACLEYYENALYNHILPSQAPRPGAGAFVYYTPMRPGFARSYGTPFASFWCCTGTGMENHARYGAFVYTRDDRGLSVNLFVASELRWPERGLVLRQETRFPDAPESALVVVSAPAEPLRLRIRRPAWLAPGGPGVAVNGEAAPASGDSGWVELTRAWKAGDRVTVGLAARLRVIRQKHAPAWAAVYHGPVLLAGELGADGLEDRDFIGPYTPVKALLPLDRAPRLVADGDEAILTKIAPDPVRPGAWRTKGLVRPADVALAPLFRVHFQRAAICWRVATESDWEAQQRRLAEEERLERAIDARTVDRVRVGEQQPETDHNLRFERSSSGMGPEGRRWRHAEGWFSYDLALPPSGTPAALRALYWGPDGGRTFDIQVDGRTIATQKLDGSRPGYFAVEVPLPADRVAGKEKVTVRFEAKPGSRAGGLFDLRVVKPE
jgi:hypothetical protein